MPPSESTSPGTNPLHRNVAQSLCPVGRAAYLAVLVFQRQEWAKLGSTILHRFAAMEQTPDGFWGEHSRLEECTSDKGLGAKFGRPPDRSRKTPMRPSTNCDLDGDSEMRSFGAIDAYGFIEVARTSMCVGCVTRPSAPPTSSCIAHSERWWSSAGQSFARPDRSGLA
jgi:hypothetical protein